MNGGNFKIPPPQEIQRVTEEVLSRPEFNQLRAASEQKESWLDRFFDWLGSLRLFESGPVGAFIIKLLITALLVALVLYLVRLLLTEPLRLKRTIIKDSVKASSVQEQSPSGKDTGSSLRQAEQALNSGDIRSAIRILYRTFIKLLSQKSFLKLERWKTNLAYLKECPKDIKQYSLLREITLAYNNIVYAHHPYEKKKIAQLLSELKIYGKQG